MERARGKAGEMKYAWIKVMVEQLKVRGRNCREHREGYKDRDQLGDFFKKKVRQRNLMQPGCNQDASRGPHETLPVPSDRSRAKGSRVWRLNEHINQWAR